jgi:Electron transfer DM13
MKMQQRMIGLVSLAMLSAGAIVAPVQIHASFAESLVKGEAIAQTTPTPAMQKPDSMMKPDAMGKPNSMMKPNVMAAKGKFVKAEHPTQGMAKLVSSNGASFIEFDSAFKTETGPDLHVILYRTTQPPIGGLKEADYVNLGKLQKISGTQRYMIPKSANLANYSSVAVWCQKFNATFGYAALK